MKKKWFIKDKDNEDTKKHLAELKLYCALFCNKEMGLFTLYKSIASPDEASVTFLSTDVENCYVVLDLIHNKLRVDEKPSNVGWDEYFK